jgi:hypothetical protein
MEKVGGQSRLTPYIQTRVGANTYEGYDKDESSSQISNTQIYHIGDILNGIGEYFKALRALRRHDFSTYSLFRKIGAVILSGSGDAMYYNQLDPRIPSDPHKWPAFFMSAYTMPGYRKNEGDFATPRMVYFQKYRPHHSRLVTPPRPNSILYEGNLFYAPYWLPKGMLNPFMIAVDLNDGTISSVPFRHGQYQRIRSHGEEITIHHNRMIHSHDLREIWHEVKHRNGGSPHTPHTLNDFASNLFFLALSGTIAALDGIQVNVSRGKDVGRFGVPIERSAEFFRNREFAANSKGSRARIFHYVRPHDRVGTTGVRAHYRGAREFEWNGLKVWLTVPRYHHKLLEEFNGAAISVDEKLPIPKGLIPHDRLGDMMADVVIHHKGKPYGPVVAPGEVRRA